jgi:ribose 5-phosphate isomerase B
MLIALCSDEVYPVHVLVRDELARRGHEVLELGALAAGHEVAWATATEEAALLVARGPCQEGVFFCWSGTGVTMAANKVSGIRAALCTDPGMARAARRWNHANVLCLSNRLLSADMAREMLDAWFEPYPSEQGRDGVRALGDVEARHLKGSS